VQGKTQNMRLNALVLAGFLALPTVASAQPALLDAYGRASALLNFMTAYVGESLLACAERGFFTEAQAEARFKAYRERNAALLERADRWRQEAENRLRTRAEERQGQERAAESGSGATTLALARVREEMGRVRDPGALCAGKLAGIEAGRYDLSLNAELVGLLGKVP